ncbi:hypothetical protein ABFS82_13G118600 [Erythranthe guttata]|uniref:Uncharacterized protein n=1 Tax=Erythranthe guttata TaxID=4155 RepID=A0A022QIP8_ERYGU|nr:PREDICTED: trans-alpha-bergamotene synthase-like [Erythranthe guttata]EYU27851.1 hypothetical protein MIMGU_mgv1a023119mg [Erythranthe guttata]|eukprot:XP_012848434.1 PREDICTED: trans-alpha-bergamotene synthase-like [Erythranthe guttata]
MEEARRSGNYGRSIWDHDYVQSLATPYTDEKYVEQAEKLRRQVQIIIDETENHTLEQLELIDNLQRFHISDHFEDSIKKILGDIYRDEFDDGKHVQHLHVTSLKFRLLRQNGFLVPQEVFGSFLDKEGNFKECFAGDVKGVLSLYEASFLSVEGERILDSAKKFSTRHLTEKVKQIEDTILAEKVRHALELPLHWRVHKLEARWFMNIYNGDPILLQLAALDFNMVQAIYQDELKQLSRWHKETGLADKLGFARDRLPECYLWAVGYTPEVRFGYPREFMTKIAVMITIIDDIYDVYGTMDELELFTDTVERWDINALDRLPEYMRISFLALFNCANEFAYKVLRDQGLIIISKLRKLWAELCRAYYKEAQWFHSGYRPSTNEYINLAWVSITGPLLLFHGYFCITNPINTKDLHFLEQYPGIIRWPATVLRLADDLGTSSAEIKRGDVPKYIQCYMHETGCSEEDAREHIKKDLIDDLLKKMNNEILFMDKPIENFQTIAMNLARIGFSFYQFGDGFGSPDSDTKTYMVSLLVEPIPIPSTSS